MVENSYQMTKSSSNVAHI